MQADTGPIGGDLSHEFIILAETGEIAVYCDRAWLATDILAAEVDYRGDLEPMFRRWTGLYAATDEKHDHAACPVPPEQLVTARGIEVGHIFYFGDKYSRPMGADGRPGPTATAVALEMGSYGIGVSRLVGALIEANHDDAGIIWPRQRRAVPRRADQSALRPMPGAAPPPMTFMPNCSAPASRRSTTIATNRPAPNSPRWI